MRAFAAVLPNGKIWKDRVYFTVPGRKKHDRSCTLMLTKGGTDFVVKDHHRDAWSWRDLKDYVRKKAGIEFRRRDPDAIKRKQVRQNAKRKADRAARRKIPLRTRRPWEALGISERTWYRRGRPQVVAANLPTPYQVSQRLVVLDKQMTKGGAGYESQNTITPTILAARAPRVGQATPTLAFGPTFGQGRLATLERRVFPGWQGQHSQRRSDRFELDQPDRHCRRASVVAKSQNLRAGEATAGEPVMSEDQAELVARLVTQQAKLDEQLDADARQTAHALIQEYLGPDHKVTNMQSFYSALVQALKAARGQGQTDMQSRGM